MVCGGVGAATTYNVRTNRARIQMRERQNDIARSKLPTAALPANPESRVKDFLVDRHALNIPL